MELYVNPTITGFRQEVDGTIKELKIGSNKEDAYANIIGQAEGADLENNKAKTINVSTYTEPVEVTPTAGKDGMKKATITLSNIPSGNGKLYCWGTMFTLGLDAPCFYTTSATPSANDVLLTSSGESGFPSIIENTTYKVKAYSEGAISVLVYSDEEWTDFTYDGHTSFVRWTEKDIEF